MTSPDKGIVEKLKYFGLTKNEANVYIALLELGRGTVSQISRKGNVNRTTGYDILDSLVSKGLVQISGKEPKQEYVAEHPDNFLKILNARIEEAKEDFEKAKEFVPELKSFYKVEGRPKVRFFEGEEGLREVFEDTLRIPNKKMVAFAALEAQHAAIKNFFPRYYERRVENNISMRAIFPKTPMGIERASKDKEELRESKFVPAEGFGFNPAINVYDDKVMIASFPEKLGIIIESPQVADVMRKIFELAWLGADRLENK
jgi:HTH-type transcriptional regulator, sugar sensing transcriptional regulator